MPVKWLVRYSEIFLKSDPVRRQWERALMDNIREMIPDITVQSNRGRIWLEGDVKPEVLKNIFGIVSFSEVVQKGHDERIEDALLDYCKKKGLSGAGSFALRIRRVGNHAFSSHDKAVEYGNLICREFPGIRVNLAAPEKEIFVEIRGEECYFYDNVTKSAGGIPCGVEGTLVALVSGGIDSPVAAWMMMRRGCRIVPLFVAAEEILDDTVLARAKNVVGALRKYQPDIRLRVVYDGYLAAAKKELGKNHQEKYTCIFCKRRMYRIAQEVAKEIGAKGIVTGESLGQVASQTLDNLAVLDDAAQLPVYRPLIGFDKTDTISLAREIGTYDLSVAKASGCKAVPKSPSTKAQLQAILDLEKKLNANAIPLPRDG